MGFFERYLTVWVALCIVVGIALGKFAPEVAQSLDAMAITVDGAPVVSIPIALCLFFMMYPIMVKIDFGEVVKAGKSVKPVTLTLVINWLIKPFTMVVIASLVFVAGAFALVLGRGRFREPLAIEGLILPIPVMIASLSALIDEDYHLGFELLYLVA